LRKKPKKSAKVSAKRQRTEESASGPETPPAKPTDMREQQSPVDLALEAKATLVRGVIVSAMQDTARLTMALEGRGSMGALPNKLWNWLWFRRHILSVLQRCSFSERLCHVLGMSVSECAVSEEEFPSHVRGQPANSSVVSEFREDIDLFRRWVLDSEVLTLRRHDGYLNGELGLMLLKPALHDALRQAIPGFVVEIWAYLRTELEHLGYASLLNDRGKNYILFGPLALLQSGTTMGIEKGAVQGCVDWHSSRGTNIVVNLAPAGDIRLIRMKAKRAKDEDETCRKSTKS